MASERWWWFGAGACVAAAAWVWLSPPDELEKLRSKARSTLLREREMQPSFGTDVLKEFRILSEDHYTRILDNLHGFSVAYQESYKFDKCSAAQVRVLFDHRARALSALGELSMRLPNDMKADARLKAFTEKADRLMTAYIEDVKARSNVGLHLAPLDDFHYGETVRAMNDVYA